MARLAALPRVLRQRNTLQQSTLLLSQCSPLKNALCLTQLALQRVTQLSLPLWPAAKLSQGVLGATNSV
jgi:hypothetical protein